MLTKETRLIDSKELLKNPYQKLIDMLQEGLKFRKNISRKY